MLKKLTKYGYKEHFGTSQVAYEWDTDQIIFSLSIIGSMTYEQCIAIARTYRNQVLLMPQGDKLYPGSVSTFASYFYHEGWENKKRPKDIDDSLIYKTKFTVQVFSQENTLKQSMGCDVIVNKSMVIK